MRYQVIDNFLPTQQANFIEEVMLGVTFPWYISGTISPDQKYYSTAKVNSQFVHLFFLDMVLNSNYFDQLIKPIVDVIQPSAMIRIKANLLTKTQKQLLTGYHRDTDCSSLTGIYYVNNNNGFTVFKDGDKIESVKNRFLVFNSELLHSGSTCTDNNYRCVLNFNYYGSTDGVNV